MKKIILIWTMLLTGCHSDKKAVDPAKGHKLASEKNYSSDLDFICTQEKFPKASQDADLLFNYARWLQKNNQLSQDENINIEIGRLYRIAAKQGHYKANINLQNGARRGVFKVSDHDMLRFSQNLIDNGVASGYYLIATYLERGLSILPKNSEAALQYFRKAADEGSAEAQEYVGEKLIRARLAWDSAWDMRRCAAEQGQGRSAIAVGVNLRGRNQYEEAVKFFQLGVAAGNESSAGLLHEGFSGPDPSHQLYYLGLEKDIERAERYKKIWRILANYSYANPKIPEINEIVPLPPAPLPVWNGKLQWLEDRLANIPPEKPSGELIKRLADEKLLESDTGRPRARR